MTAEAKLLYVHAASGLWDLSSDAMSTAHERFNLPLPVDGFAFGPNAFLFPPDVLRTTIDHKAAQVTQKKYTVEKYTHGSVVVNPIQRNDRSADGSAQSLDQDKNTPHAAVAPQKFDRAIVEGRTKLSKGRETQEKSALQHRRESGRQSHRARI